MTETLCQLIVDQHEGKKLAVPVAGEQVWFWFRELDSQRTGNGFGPNPLGFEAIHAWSQVRGVRLLQWQVDAIVRMDLKRRQILSKREDDEAKPEEPKVSLRPLSSRLFDALFGGR
ncbi:phage tail assembly chaperone [Agrobacterium tumefaciens]|uniref:phage tail assembly chaperone n=1 Tax=Agrobacterium tumefaciens TaxID=358 RepID=UPI003B9E7DAE